MTNPTSNFGWQMPTSSDLVTDLPADFEVFGQAVDTSLADLKGGTTGQVLKKNSNTDMDFVWSADSAGMTNPMTTTGDTIYSSSGSTPARLGIGSTGQVLTVSGGLPSWATPTSGAPALAQIASGSLTSGTQLQLSSLTSYDTLIFRVSGFTWATGSDTLYMRINNSSSAVYDQLNGRSYATANYSSADFYDSGNAIYVADQSMLNTYSGTAAYVIFTNCKAAGFTNAHFMFRGRDTGNQTAWGTGEVIFKSAAAVSTLEFFTGSSRTFTAGNYVLWGA